jgi:hypothetical protein
MIPRILTFPCQNLIRNNPFKCELACHDYPCILRTDDPRIED